MGSSTRAIGFIFLTFAASAFAQAPLFKIDKVERVKVQLMDRPGHGELIYARFRWHGSDQDLIASLNAESCRSLEKHRVGGIGWPDRYFHPKLMSLGERDYDWTANGPKPTDKLFTAICNTK